MSKAKNNLLLDKSYDANNKHLSTQLMSLAAYLAMLCSIPLAFHSGLIYFLLINALAVLLLITSGALILKKLSSHSDAPVIKFSISLALKAAIDELVLGILQIGFKTAIFKDLKIANEEADLMIEYQEANNITAPSDYHRKPPPIDNFELVAKTKGKTKYEHLRFTSLYEPRENEPGGERWKNYDANKITHAYVLRQKNYKNRPWLICINGFGTGSAAVDLLTFKPTFDEFKFNVLIYVMPFHGPRKNGFISGNGFLTGNPIDTLHAESQAIWDLRRIISWINDQGCHHIGIAGISLGGYTAALLSTIQEDLKCTIPFVPLSCFASAMYHYLSKAKRAEFEKHGLTLAKMQSVLKPISPLASPSKTKPLGRAIIAGVVDQIVERDQTLSYKKYWLDEEIRWLDSCHMFTTAEAEANKAARNTLDKAGFLNTLIEVKPEV